MDDALLLVGRLNTLLTRLHRRRATAENAERVAAWNKDFGSMTERRDTLAAELVEAFSELSRVSEVFSRITIFEAELSNSIRVDRAVCQGSCSVANCKPVAFNRLIATPHRFSIR